MLKFVLRALDEKLLFPYRHNKLTERLLPLLNGVTNLLDVGTGDGHLAKHITQAVGCHTVGLDICLQPYSYIKVHPYDGHTFPFEDNTFDCVMMVDMLHHTTNIDQMISEACRVSKRFVIIKDHYWETRMDIITLHVADYLGNLPYNVPLPYNFFRLEEWKKLFYRHNLNEISQATFKYNRFEPAHHIMVKLETEKIAVNQSVNGAHMKPHHVQLQPIESLPINE